LPPREEKTNGERQNSRRDAPPDQEASSLCVALLLKPEIEKFTVTFRTIRHVVPVLVARGNLFAQDWDTG
jgi:hypothetical protein